MRAYELLRILILSEGLRQKDLANVLKINITHMSAILNGRKYLSVEHAKALERVFGVPAIVFLYMQNKDKWVEKIKQLESL